MGAAELELLPPHDRVRIGALVWAQHTGWAELMRAGALADRLGFDQLWTADHLLPVTGSSVGPAHEPFMTLAGWAAVTSRVSLGPMVSAVTFRNPGLLVKMITSLDHMSGGRAILGIGAGWLEAEHRAFGLELGSIRDRLERLDEAAQLISELLHGRAATARGPHFTADGVTNDPPPVQAHLPLLIGGGGERKTLATVARYADAWNVFGAPAELAHKDAVLREWCERVGRDEREIERTTGGGTVIIRDREVDGRRVADAIAARNTGWDDTVLVGSAQAVVDRLAPAVELGFRTIYMDFPAPFDDETMERFMGEVKPVLDGVSRATPGVPP